MNFKTRFVKYSINGYKGLSIYSYDDNIRTLLYQFKGCKDIELADVFLNKYSKELSIKYKGYIKIPAPSYCLDDKNREFNHVIEMFKNINLKTLSIVKKVSPFKQADHTQKERELISKHLIIEKPEQVKGKKVLIIDDVITTGSTIKAMIELIKQGCPKDIKILTMAKRELN